MSTPIHDQDVDQQETLEWLEAIEGVLQADGADRAHFFIRANDRQATSIRCKLAS